MQAQQGYLNPHQTRDRDPTDYENLLGDALEKAFAAGVHDIDGICARLIAEGGYAGDPVIVARALRVTVEGVWLDLMTMDAPYSREEGLRTVMSTAAAYFPRHFNDKGLKA